MKSRLDRKNVWHGTNTEWRPVHVEKDAPTTVILPMRSEFDGRVDLSYFYLLSTCLRL